MLQLYREFYRLVGVRRFSDMLSPRLGIFRGFPRASIYHHFSDDDELFPDPTKPYFKDYRTKLPIQQVVKTTNLDEKVHTKTFNFASFVNQYIRKSKIFRGVVNVYDIATQDNVLAVVNYNPMKFAYRYLDTPLGQLTRWEEIHRAIWDNIALTSVQSNRQNFVMLSVSANIPSLNLLKMFGEKEGLSLVRVFDTADKLMLLHLWRWLNPELRHLSVMSNLTEEAIKRVNLLFILPDGRCSDVNLSYLYSWVKGNPPAPELKVGTQYENELVVRSLLKYFLVLSSSIPEEAVEETPQYETEHQSDDHELDESGEYDSDDQLIQNAAHTSKPSEPLEALPPVEAIEDTPEHATNLVQKLDEELQILENKTQKDLARKGLVVKNKEVQEVEKVAVTYSPEAVKTEISTPLDPNQVLKLRLKQALDRGNLNAASYKKALVDSDRYLSMKDPYGSATPLKERTKIDPAALNFVEESTKLTDSPLVFDKSMTQSTLQDYTTGYIEKHLKNDILKMVGALQKGGVAVTSHEILEDVTIMGSQEIHSIDLKPIDGAASSVRLRVPTISEDGTFTVGGNKYLLRKQRVDSNPLLFLASSKKQRVSYGPYTVVIRWF